LQTKSIRQTIEISLENKKLLSKVLAIDLSITGVAFDLTTQDVEKIKPYLEQELKPEITDHFVLRGRTWIDDLSYQIHTGRELNLMLSGVKPLAFFYTTNPDLENFAHIPEVEFDHYVAQSRFVKAEEYEVDRGVAMRAIYYALPSEAWRIDAFKLLRKTAKLAGWSDAVTRMEGSLLGYTDKQNDEYLKLEMKFNKH
jgi:hypothetical protein